MLALLLVSPGASAQDDTSPPAEAPTTRSAGDPKTPKARTPQKGKAKGRKPKRLSKEMRTLVKQYRKLPAEEQKRLLKRFREELKNRTPEERKRLRLLAQKLKRDRGKKGRKQHLQKQRERLRNMDPERRKRYTKLVRKMVRELPVDERSAFAKLPPGERQQRLKSMIKAHRKGLVTNRLRRLPADVQKQMRLSLDGLEGKERFRKTRKLVETYVRGRAEAILGNQSLTPEQRQQRMRKLMGRHVPEGKRREMMLKRLRQRQERGPHKDGRPQARPRRGHEGGTAQPRRKQRGARTPPGDLTPDERKRRRRQVQKRRNKDRNP